MRIAWTVIAVLLVVAVIPAFAQSTERGQGGIVLKDDAPVYAHPRGQEVEFRMKRGESVAGQTGGAAAFFGGVQGGMFMFDEKEGRIRVIYFEPGKILVRSGWMDPADVSKFTYPACGNNATPLAAKNFKQRWNACFEEARDAKLEKLQTQWAQEATAKKEQPAATPIQ